MSDKSDTPRTDVQISEHDESAPMMARTTGYDDLLEFCRSLERELAAANSKLNATLLSLEHAARLLAEAEKESAAAIERIHELETAPCQNLEKCAEREEMMRKQDERIVAQQARIIEEINGLIFSAEHGNSIFIQDLRRIKENILITDDLSTLHARDAEMQAKVLEEAADYFVIQEGNDSDWIIEQLREMAAERRKEGKS